MKGVVFLLLALLCNVHGDFASEWTGKTTDLVQQLTNIDQTNPSKQEIQNNVNAMIGTQDVAGTLPWFAENIKSSNQELKTLWNLPVGVLANNQVDLFDCFIYLLYSISSRKKGRYLPNQDQKKDTFSKNDLKLKTYGFGLAAQLLQQAQAVGVTSADINTYIMNKMDTTAFKPPAPDADKYGNDQKLIPEELEFVEYSIDGESYSQRPPDIVSVFLIQLSTMDLLLRGEKITRQKTHSADIMLIPSASYNALQNIFTLFDMILEVKGSDDISVYAYIFDLYGIFDYMEFFYTKSLIEEDVNGYRAGCTSKGQNPNVCQYGHWLTESYIFAVDTAPPTVRKEIKQFPPPIIIGG